MAVSSRRTNFIRARADCRRAGAVRDAGRLPLRHLARCGGGLEISRHRNHNQSSPSIAADGTICVGCWDHCLHAISSEGLSKWKFHTERPVSSSAAIAADGTIYFSSQDAHCYALHPDGSLKWKLRTDSPMTSSPAITDAGDVVICNQNRSVLVLDEQNGGPASSAWPMLLGNARHNGRMEEGRIRRKGLEQPQVISNPDNPACETQSLSPQGIACQNRKRLRNRF